MLEVLSHLWSQVAVRAHRHLLTGHLVGLHHHWVELLLLLLLVRAHVLEWELLILKHHVLLLLLVRVHQISLVRRVHPKVWLLLLLLLAKLPKLILLCKCLIINIRAHVGCGLVIEGLVLIPSSYCGGIGLSALHISEEVVDVKARILLVEAVGVL